MFSKVEYRNVAIETIALAEKFLSRPIQEETRKRVVALMRCMYWCDRYLDNHSLSDSDVMIADIFQVLTAGKVSTFKDAPLKLVPSLLELKDILDKSGSAQQDVFFANVKKTIHYGKIVRSTADAREFVKARKAEGECAADMVSAFAGELGCDAGFADFYRRLTSTGNCMDSIQDIRKDKMNGEIQIKPIRVYFSLAKAVACGTMKLAWGVSANRALVGYLVTVGMRHLLLNTLKYRYVRTGYKYIVGRRHGRTVNEHLPLRTRLGAPQT
jgi:hypothetical protein